MRLSLIETIDSRDAQFRQPAIRRGRHPSGMAHGRKQNERKMNCGFRDRSMLRA
jgi:hypothetical protein